MATIVAGALPKFVVIRSNDHTDKGNAYYKAESASVLVGEDDVFSTLVKLEVERATSGDKYVNIRFCYFNRYWHRSAANNFIVAESDQPDEDTASPSCTLLEPIEVDDGVFYLNHVQSGGRLLVDGPSLGFKVELNPSNEQGRLTFVDWNTVVKMPASVAFKGDIGKYIAEKNGNLQFSSEDYNDEPSGFTVELSDDGHVQIRPAGQEYYWGLSPTVNEWVNTIDPFNQRIRFWPVKMDENSIALRSLDNNKFCRRLTSESEHTVDGLSASATTITKEAILQVQELVLGRKIYNVRFQMEYARIFDETPFVAGTTTTTNDRDEEASMGVSVTYTDEKSYTFSRSLSLTAGISSTIEVGLPFIAGASITVSYEINGTFQWDDTKTDSVSVTADGSVPVPGKTTVTVDYVGTRGTCNIPYSYTQEDKSSTDGHPIYTDLFDGIYTGVSYYNFSFHVR